MVMIPDNSGLNKERASPIPVVDIQFTHISNSFKIWVFGIIFVLTLLRLITVLAFPYTGILSDKIILSVVLAVVSYLWAQEVRDRQHLQTVNHELISAQKKLQDAEVNAISALALLEEAKDPYARGHSQRVTEYSLEIARAMKFSQDTLDVIARSGMLHDIGKLAIKDEILTKPGRLSREDWEIIRQHPVTAVQILEPLKFLFLEKKVIRYHHERIDGKGYPDGLMDTDIPLESRIIAVADTFDAMNSARIYRDPCTKGYILEELARVAGTQLDERIVDVFLKVLESHPVYWERK